LHFAIPQQAHSTHLLLCTWRITKPTAPKMPTTATLSSVIVYGTIFYCGQYYAALVQTHNAEQDESHD
jgi:hypothetical protein